MPMRDRIVVRGRYLCGASGGYVHALRFRLDRPRLRIPWAASEILGHGSAALALP